MTLTRIQHGFDSEDHAGFKFKSLARIAVMQDLRLIVIDLANPVTAIFAHAAESIPLRDRLDLMTDVAQRGTRANDANAGAQQTVPSLTASRR